MRVAPCIYRCKIMPVFCHIVLAAHVVREWITTTRHARSKASPSICNSNDHIIYYVWLYRLLDQEYWKTAASVLLFWSLLLAGWTEFDADDAAEPLCCLFGLGGASGPCDTPSSLSWAASMSKSYHPHTHTHNPVSHCSETPPKIFSKLPPNSQTSRKDNESDRQSRKYCV